ncbi:hypothetical protein ED551_06760 [Muribaculaceae bacterium Isolate-013 (NCI)]|nr:hypothetical protein ED551_06760 [Muribaculaceae bacterium Isolate-013 (NCI)]
MSHRFLIYITLLFAALLPQAAGAQLKTAENLREKWFSEIRQVKRNYFVKELDLSREQQNKFFPLYEEMEDRTFRIDDEARQMGQRIAEAKDATDTEYEKAAEALYDADVQTSQIRREYMDKFKTILTSRQLFELKNVERKFSREMMRQHNRLRSEKKRN